MNQSNDLDLETNQTMNYDEGVASHNNAASNDSNVFVRQLSALPSFATYCKLEWSNIDVFLGDDKTGKQILHNFHGMIES